MAADIPGLSFRPVNDRNAIVQAAFVIEIADPIPSSVLRQFAALHPDFRARYPRRNEGRGFQVTFGVGGGSVAQSVPTELTSVTFDSLKSDGAIERAISVGTNMIAITRSDYSRWTEVWAETYEIFRKLFPLLTFAPRATTVSLQYHDRFVWDGPIETLNCRSLIREKCEYIPSNVTRTNRIQTSSGWQRPTNDPIPHALATTLVFAVGGAAGVGADPQHRAVVDLIINLRRVISTPVNLEKGLIDSGYLDRFMSEMHNRNKYMLREILSDEILRQLDGMVE